MDTIFSESSSELQQLRDLYIIRDGIVFLNHRSFGACPRPVLRAYQRWQLELERQPIEFLSRRYTELMLSARQALAGYVGAEADEIVYAPNATTALNLIARSMGLQPGDEVLSTTHEYGAMNRTWEFSCQQRDARYVTRGFTLPIISAESLVDELWAGVTDRVKVLFLSHITSPTALILPLEPVIARAREAGIVTVVDGAHAPGQLPLDLHALGADFYVGNCHKWLCAPKGSAFLFARRVAQEMLQPLVVSWGWHAEKPGPSKIIDEQEWQGTRDIAASLAVPEAIAMQREHNWASVQQYCRALARYARGAIGDLTGLAPLCPDSHR